MNLENDIRFTILETSRCQRCDWRFIGEGKLCPECVENPTSDRDEDRFLTSGDVFEFMGWKFKVRIVDHHGHPEPLVFMNCYKRLHNPESPALVLSYRQHPVVSNMAKLKRDMAAWLIAHWWEHYFDFCPCQNGVQDDEHGSNFRVAMIESLIWYSENMELSR